MSAVTVGIGAIMLATWTFLLATRRVPEIAARDKAIWFHLAAEFVTAGLLLAAGVALAVVEGPWTAALAGTALGALVYTALASPGYYANLGQWAAVAMFGVIASLALAAVGVLLSG